MRFSLIRHQRDDRMVTLALAGEVDMDAVDPLTSALEDALSTPGPVGVVVDLAMVTFMDCAGIGALVAGRNAAAARGCGYTVVNPRRQVRRVLELTGALTALTVRPVPVPVAVRATRSRRTRGRRDDRRVAAGSPAPSVADASVSRTKRSS